MACTPEHASEPDAKRIVSADANTDGGVLDAVANPDADRSDRAGFDTAMTDTPFADHQNQDTGLVDGMANDTLASDHNETNDSGGTGTDANSSDTAANPDAGNPCEGVGLASGHIDLNFESPADGQIVVSEQFVTYEVLVRTMNEAFRFCHLEFELCSTGQTDSSGNCTAPADEQARYALMLTELRLAYTDADNQPAEAVASLVDNRAVFDGLNLLVAKNGQQLVTLTGKTGSLADGLQSGDILKLNAVLSRDRFKAVGQDSGGNADVPVVALYNPSAPEMIFRGTKPIFINDSPWHYESFFHGWNTVVEFRIKANEQSEIRMNGWLISVITNSQSTGFDLCPNLGQGNRWRLLYNSQSITDDDDWLFLAGTSNSTEPCAENPQWIVRYVYLDFNRVLLHPALLVPAGQEIALELQVDMTGTALNDSIDIMMMSQTQTNASPIFGAYSAQDWSDGLVDHIDGSYIEGLPLFGSLRMTE
ncbi:hypothetical protein KJ611_02940 [Patescibacteria group bacterium]|nr:hypothetical protein [Patescibacteria group bacterium]MBU1705238.1 hypothetical protein [Patescibacteria group bacterium]